MFKTPVSILQEVTVQKKIAVPDYKFDGTGHPHSMSFTCKVTTGNHSAVGEGNTKKDAKQDAAKNMLKKFGVNLESPSQMSQICILPSKPSKVDGHGFNYIGKLNEFCSGNRYPQPNYIDDITVQNGKFCMICAFNNFRTHGFGLNKKDAKQDAAKKMLALIKENDLGFNPVETPTEIEDTQFCDEVLKKYTELMQNINISDVKCENNNLKTFNTKESNIHTWEDLTEFLDKHGYRHELTIFQPYPLIFSLKINEHVLMNYGKSKEEILEKFVINVANMIKQGIDFSKPLLA